MIKVISTKRLISGWEKWLKQKSIGKDDGSIYDFERYMIEQHSVFIATVTNMEQKGRHFLIHYKFQI